MLVQDEINIQGSSINQKPNSTMSIMPCTGTTFVIENSCLVARIVSFDTLGLPLLTFRILELYHSKDIALDLTLMSRYLTLMSLLQYLLSLI